MPENPFADPRGLVFELVDDWAGKEPSPVHRTQSVRVNGLEISQWIADGAITIRTDRDGLDRVDITFLAAGIHTIRDAQKGKSHAEG